MISKSLVDLFERGWLVESELLQVTQEGKAYLQSQARKVNQLMGSSFIEVES